MIESGASPVPAALHSIDTGVRPAHSGAIEKRLRSHSPVSLFGILHSRSASEWSSTMIPGPWMTTSDGSVRPGTLAVLADIGISMPALVSRTDLAVATVTTGLWMAFVPDVDLFDGPMAVAAELIYSDGTTTAQTVGRLLTSSGDIAAAVQLTTHLMPLPAGMNSLDESLPLLADPDLTLDLILGSIPRRTTDGAELTVVVEPWLASPRGTMHGGIIAAIVEYVAAHSGTGSPTEWAVDSLGVHYLRPTLLGDIVTVKAVVVKEGKNLAFVRVEAIGSGQQLLWTGECTFRTGGAVVG